MDLEAQNFHDDPECDEIIDNLTDKLFQISSTNGKIAELLRKDRRAKPGLNPALPEETSITTMDLAQRNQQRFRDLKSEIEQLEQWKDPSPSLKYSQHKIAADFGKLFIEFKTIQQQVLDFARSTKKSSSSVYRDSPDATKLHTNPLPAAESPVDPLTDYQDEPLEQTLAFEDQIAQHEISYQQGLIADREEEIENVAQGMNELNEIYTNLGAIVREQGITLDNIEANMYNVASNVRSGAQQLTKAHNWQKRSSGRMCAFLIILLIVAAFMAIAIKA